jgi:hypothetical protein
MNATQTKIAYTLAASKPNKNDYANAVMDSQTCSCSAKVDASTWAGWAAYDAWMVTVSNFAWSFRLSDKDFNYDAFIEAAGYN